jgi:YbbR domain-containing protein
MQVIKDNLLLKFVSLLVAAILFVMLNAESSTPVEVQFPISYDTPDGFMLVGHPPTSLSATLKGPWTRFQSFREEDMLPVVVDLTQMPAEPGTIRHMVATGDIQAPLGLQAVSFRPTEWDLTLDRRVERSIPVEASLPHRPAFGYEIVSVRTEPREVKVIGPRSSVMGLDYIPTRDIDIRGREGDLEVEVALRNPPHPMKLITKQVFISIEIGEEQIQRMFRNIPVKVEADGVALTVEPSTVMLRVSGPRRSVDAMKSSSLEATVKIGDELEKGLKSFEKSVELRTTLPERTQLVVPIPRVVVSVPE